MLYLAVVELRIYSIELKGHGGVGQRHVPQPKNLFNRIERRVHVHRVGDIRKHGIYSIELKVSHGRWSLTSAARIYSIELKAGTPRSLRVLVIRSGIYSIELKADLNLRFLLGNSYFRIYSIELKVEVA